MEGNSITQRWQVKKLASWKSKYRIPGSPDFDRISRSDSDAWIAYLYSMIKTHRFDKARNARNMCKMKNLTLRIDEKLLGKARRIAMEQGRTVNSLVREYLEDYVQSHDRQAQARRELAQLFRGSTASSGGVKWTREELYDRR